MTNGLLKHEMLSLADQLAGFAKDDREELAKEKDPLSYYAGYWRGRSTVHDLAAEFVRELSELIEEENDVE